MLYNTIYALWVMWPSYFIGLIECIIGILTLGFYSPYWSLDWMEFALDNFPKWAGEKNEDNNPS